MVGNRAVVAVVIKYPILSILPVKAFKIIDGIYPDE